jgi:hypothetical protein
LTLCGLKVAKLAIASDALLHSKYPVAHDAEGAGLGLQFEKIITFDLSNA